MGQAPVPGVKRVAKKTDATALVPGQLVRDDQGQWDFMGNGATTANQVTARMLTLEATQYGAKSGLPSALPPAVQSEVTKELLKENPQLNSSDPNAPIPSGAKFTANVTDLKKAIQPFLNNPELQRMLLTEPNPQGSGRFGDVPSHGLALPYDGS